VACKESRIFGIRRVLKKCSASGLADVTNALYENAMCGTKIQQVLLGIFYVVTYNTKIISKIWWVGGVSNPGPPD